MEKLIILVPILFLVLEAIRGYRKGLVLSILSFVSWFVSVGGSALLVREFVKKSGKLPEIAAFLSGSMSEEKAGIIVVATLFILLAIMLKIFCLIIMHFAKGLDEVPVLGLANKILGALFGIVEGILVLAMVAFVYAVYSGMYLDLIYDKIPQLEWLVEMFMLYAKSVWHMMK